MELKWLEDFLSLSDTENFRISSKRRFISQPAFSRRIIALENWMGTKLFDRTHQPVKLTSAGELFKPLALEIVQSIYQSRNDIKTQISAHEGKIRFATLSTLAQFFVPFWLKGLQPFIETESFSVRTDFRTVKDCLSALEDGSVDFFICYEDPTGTIVNYTEKFQSHQLGTETLIPVTSPDSEGKPSYWLPTTPSGTSIPYLHTNAKPSLWPINHLLQTRHGNLKFVPVYETSISTAIKAMVIEGYGIAWIPKAIIADDLDNGLLVRAAPEQDDILLNIKIYQFQNNTDLSTEKFWQTLVHQDDNELQT